MLTVEQTIGPTTIFQPLIFSEVGLIVVRTGSWKGRILPLRQFGTLLGGKIEPFVVKQEEIVW